MYMAVPGYVQQVRNVLLVCLMDIVESVTCRAKQIIAHRLISMILRWWLRAESFEWTLRKGVKGLCVGKFADCNKYVQHRGYHHQHRAHAQARLTPRAQPSIN